jgi:hypothetical protein
MEELLAEFFLCYIGLKTPDDYEELLHSLFLESPENEFLFTLEENPEFSKNTIGCITTYCNDNGNGLNYDTFGRKIISELNKIYLSSVFDMNKFKNLCSGLYWLMTELLGEPIHDHPFLLLSIGDEVQGDFEKEYFKILFNHYDNLT